jgi:hypothetical protein
MMTSTKCNIDQQQELIQMASMTPTEFAVTVSSTGREVRKFLRSITPRDEQPGKGSRWVLDANKRSIARMTKNFNEWKRAQLEAAAAKLSAEAAELEVEDDAELEVEDDDAS